MKKLFIIDASGYLYRSYFAIRNITNAKGESTNALFGFIRSIQKLRKDFAPEYLISVFDGPKSIQKRKEIYSEYKAHRAVTPPDLSYQIDWAHKMCELAGIPHLSIHGVEADDTMGSIALWAEKEGFHTYLCTSDKDLNQLVSDKISILNTFKENLILGPKEVKEAFGVAPAQMIDYLAMTGDASDNVPGLPGFGPKTVSALLQQYGSLDYILEHPEVVSGKKSEVIKQYEKQVLLSRELVTIHTNVDFPHDPAFFAIKPFPSAPLREFYASMNFNTLIRELDQDSSSTTIPAIEVTETLSYTLVNSEEALNELAEFLSKQTVIGVSAKGTQEQPIKAELIGISFCITPGTAWYIPVQSENLTYTVLGLQYILKALKPIFENPNIHFFGHNIKFDYLLLENYGIRINSICFDTMLASYILNSHSRQHSIEHLMLEQLGKAKKSLVQFQGKGKSSLPIAEIAPELMLPFCCEEMDFICRLKVLLENQLEARQLTHILYKIELPLLTVLANMERHGIYLDRLHLEKIAKEILKSLASLEENIYFLAGEKFNINSPKQMSEILFGKLGIKAPKKTATGLSTNADVLESLKDQYPICGKILEYRTLEKLRSTYLDALPSEIFSLTNRIHCTFNQTVAATGRLSCQDPNLQNIPIRTEEGRKIREAFKPQLEGWSYLAADYSQIELRLLAHFSGDERLVHAFQNGEDIHTQTSAAIFNIPIEEVTKAQRYQAKAVNFGIVYGQQAYGLSQELGIEVKEAALFIEAYFKLYPKVKTYIEESIAKARSTGKSVTYFGRERLIPEISSNNGQIRAAAERLAMNTPLQGSAADLIKLAMLEVDKKLTAAHLKAFMILQIHDELVFEVPDDEIEQVKVIVYDAMKNIFNLYSSRGESELLRSEKLQIPPVSGIKVPLEVDIVIGKNWAEC